MANQLTVGIVGAGLIGKRRAKVVQQDSQAKLLWIADTNATTAEAAAQELSTVSFTDWKKAIQSEPPDVVIVSTPNFLLAPIAIFAMRSGSHVLIEKPMGREYQEAAKMARAADQFRRKLKVGFNHRYHPAIKKAFQLVRDGKIGIIISIRAVYGHGGRKGYEKEWRGNRNMAGGGELTDQGVHLLDLIQWFMGAGPIETKCFLQRAVWPLKESEDNGFALLKFRSGAVAQFHSSWTQWKNQFTFEIFGSNGSIGIWGLGGSYGTETLKIALRKKEGGVPNISEEKFDLPDDSWQQEWEDFKRGIRGKNYWGNPQESLAVMKTLQQLYKKGGRIAVVEN